MLKTSANVKNKDGEQSHTEAQRAQRKN